MEMTERPFLQQVRDGDAAVDEVTVWTERWHEGDWPMLELYEVLGLSREQYSEYVNGGGEEYLTELAAQPVEV